MRVVMITGISLLLSACGATSEKFETVSIRVGNVSCTENIRIDRSSTSSVRYRGGALNGGSLDVQLSGPLPVKKNDFEFKKRCQEIVESATAAAKAEAELMITKSAEARSNLAITEAYNDQQMKHLKADDYKIDSSY